MKIVILAGGHGKRMGNLTDELPKPLLKYKGKTLLEHKLENIPSSVDSVDEIIIVIGYLGDKIKESFKNSYKEIPIKYIEQEKSLGTAHALWQCKECLNEDFVVLMGDDIFSKKDIQRLIDSSGWSILVSERLEEETSDPEKEKIPKILRFNTPEFRYTGGCHLTPEIFETSMEKTEKGELGLPQTIAKFVDTRNIEVLRTRDWIRITSPEDLN